MQITRVPIITFTDMKQSCSANEHQMFCFSLVLFVCLFLKTVLFSLKQVLSNFYAIGFLWRRCNFRGKCRSRYCDVAKTTCGIRQSNYLPFVLYRIPLSILCTRVVECYFFLKACLQYRKWTLQQKQYVRRTGIQEERNILFNYPWNHRRNVLYAFIGSE